MNRISAGATIFGGHLIKVLFGCMMIGLLWLGINHNLQFRQELLHQAAVDDAKNLATIFGEHVSRTVKEADKILLLIRAAHDVAPEKFDLLQWVNQKNFKSDLHVQYAHIGLEGYMIASNVGPPKSRIYLGDRPHFQYQATASADELFISKPLVGRASGKISIQLSRKLTDAQGRFAGVLVSSIDPDYFVALYQQVEMGTEGVATIVGLDGVIRARSKLFADSIGQLFDMPEIYSPDALKSTGARTITDPIDGVRRITTLRRLSDFPLIVVAGVSEYEVLANIKSEAGPYYIMGFIMTGVMVLLLGSSVYNSSVINLTLIDLAEERDRAQAASKAKSMFLAMMSHEIRTPMNAILGMSSSLLEEQLPTDQRASVKAIHEAGDSLLVILNDILDYSKLEAGQLKLELFPFSPRELSHNVASIVRPSAASKQLQFTVYLAPGLPDFMEGDAARLRQVLLNLLSNAIKFTATGSVTLTATCVEVHGEQATIDWTVSDTGIGIPRDRIRSLFQEFAQVDNSISRKYGGSGLGLSICKKIIEQMDGRIAISSAEGVGTTIGFRVKLKKVKPALVAANPSTILLGAVVPEVIKGLGRRARVLVVDDTAANQMVAVKMLKELEIDLDCADDGVAALSACDKVIYDIVFMDVRMPRMDGLTATRILRQRGFAGSIVGFTANAYEEDIKACKDAGMDDFVAKPIRKAVMLEALRRALVAHCVVAAH